MTRWSAEAVELDAAEISKHRFDSPVSSPRRITSLRFAVRWPPDDLLRVLDRSLAILSLLARRSAPLGVIATKKLTLTRLWESSSQTEVNR